MSHPALTQLRALRYFDQIPALDPQQLTGCCWKIP
jgi:chorismate--pyruvate lyase